MTKRKKAAEKVAEIARIIKSTRQDKLVAASALCQAKPTNKK